MFFFFTRQHMNLSLNTAAMQAILFYMYNNGDFSDISKGLKDGRYDAVDLLVGIIWIIYWQRKVVHFVIYTKE